MNEKFNKYSRLPTEQNNPRTRDLDRVPLRRVLEILNHEDMLIPLALAKAIPQIEKAARAVSKSYLAGRRIFFIGAGTSGRLGVLEAAEIPPTYGVSTDVFTALMAGGLFDLNSLNGSTSFVIGYGNDISSGNQRREGIDGTSNIGGSGNRRG